MNHQLTTTERVRALGATPQTIRNLHSKQPESLDFAYRYGNKSRGLFGAEDAAQFLRAREQAEKKQQTLNKK